MTKAEVQGDLGERRQILEQLRSRPLQSAAPPISHGSVPRATSRARSNCGCLVLSPSTWSLLSAPNARAPASCFSHNNHLYRSSPRHAEILGSMHWDCSPNGSSPRSIIYSLRHHGKGCKYMLAAHTPINFDDSICCLRHSHSDLVSHCASRLFIPGARLG